MQSLVQKGFEDVRALQTKESVTVSVGNVPFRWQVKAIAEALDQVAGQCDEPKAVQLILTEKDIPVIFIGVNSSDWKKFRNGLLSVEEFRQQFVVSHATGEVWKAIRAEKAENSRSGKIDVIGYPQLSFKNTLLKKPFEIQLNIAPAVNVELLRGMVFTGQVIFPLVNELGYEGDFIRPGYVTLSQDFRLPGSWLGKASVGHFNASRYGTDLYLERYFAGERLKLELNAGLTGNSHFLRNEWIRGEVQTLTWLSSVSYFYSRYNLKFKVGAGRYIYGDVGTFANCVRYFGETAFGFYVLHGSNGFNGGFSLTVPFGSGKRSKRRSVSFSVPRYFELTYDAGTEFRYSQTYGTSPSENRINLNYFTEYITNEIIHLNN